MNKKLTIFVIVAVLVAFAVQFIERSELTGKAIRMQKVTEEKYPGSSESEINFLKAFGKDINEINQIREENNNDAGLYFLKASREYKLIQKTPVRDSEAAENMD